MILSAFLWILLSWLKVVDEAFIQHKQAYSIMLRTWALYTDALPLMSSLLATFLRAPTFRPVLEAMDDMCFDHDDLLSVITPRISSSSWTASWQSPKYRWKMGYKLCRHYHGPALCWLKFDLPSVGPGLHPVKIYIEAGQQSGCYPVAVLGWRHMSIESWVICIQEKFILAFHLLGLQLKQKKEVAQ